MAADRGGIDLRQNGEGLLVHDPHAPARPGETCDELTQTTDLTATFFDLFGLTPMMEGMPLRLAREGPFSGKR